jgi:hypothetical protein
VAYETCEGENRLRYRLASRLFNLSDARSQPGHRYSLRRSYGFHGQGRRVRTHFLDPGPASSEVDADLEVQFAGQTAHYAHVAFQRVAQGSQVHIAGVIPATCSDFKIERPTFLTVPIKNEIPVRVDLTWRPN